MSSKLITKCSACECTKSSCLVFFSPYLAYLNKLRNTAKDLDNENDGKYIYYL